MGKRELTKADTPNPGSPEAIYQGCVCAVLDNAHGRGYYGRKGMFVVTVNCPLHGLGSEWGQPAPVEANHGN